MFVVFWGGGCHIDFDFETRVKVIEVSLQGDFINVFHCVVYLFKSLRCFYYVIYLFCTMNDVVDVMMFALDVMVPDDGVFLLSLSVAFSPLSRYPFTSFPFLTKFYLRVCLFTTARSHAKPFSLRPSLRLWSHFNTLKTKDLFVSLFFIVDRRMKVKQSR